VDVGTVFTWDKFPYPGELNSPIKRRWFVYLGRSSTFNNPVYIYIITATTQLRHYESYNNRSNHLCIRFDAGRFGFEQKCILDIDGGFYSSITEERFNYYKSSCIKKGRFDENTLRGVYNLLIKSQYISKRIKRDIHESLNMAGITQLKQPK